MCAVCITNSLFCLIKSATSVCLCREEMYSKIVQFIYNLKTKAGEDCVEIACFHNHTAWNMIFDFSKAITDIHVSFFIHVKRKEIQCQLFGG